MREVDVLSSIKFKKTYLFPIAFVFAIIMSGCGGGAGGGWSSGDVPTTDTGSVEGYVYQRATAASRLAARDSSARDVLIPLKNAIVVVGDSTTKSDTNGYYKIDYVPVGTYTIIITATGFETVTVENVKVAKNGTTTATQQGDDTYAMIPSGSVSLLISSTPSSAAIFLNGSDAGSVTPDTFTLSSGSYDIKLTHDGYEDYEQTATISATGNVSYTMTLLTTSITSSPTSVMVAAGESYAPSMSCVFSDASSGACGQLTWTSSDTSVATVSSSGVITGVAAGATTVIATRESSAVSTSIPVTVLQSGETLSQLFISGDGVAANAVSLPSGGSVTLTGACVYSLSGTSTCPTSCVYSSSNTAAGTISSSGVFSCATAGGATDITLSCSGTTSNTIEAACAVSDTAVKLNLFGAADSNGDGVADGAYATSFTVSAGSNIIIRAQIESATDITGIRSDLEFDSRYVVPVTVSDTANCASSGLSYDSSYVCVSNFGTVLSPDNPFFGATTTLDTVAAFTAVTSTTTTTHTCYDSTEKANRVNCAVSARQSNDVQPSADGTGYYVYFVLDTSATATSGTQTNIDIDTDTMQLMTTDGVEIEIGTSQVNGLTVTFN